MAGGRLWRGERMKVGLALSGGGFRATVFHLGALARLAEEGRLEDVSFLSTVSGGSLCVGLIYACSDFAWPSSSAFLECVIREARDLLTTQDLQFGLMGRVLRSPLRLFATRADDLSLLLKNRWRVTASLSALPQHPRWMINATCYETGKCWRFEPSRMGDYVFGYTHDTDIPLSDALAASAGFPGLIGPLVLDTRPRSWFKYRERGTCTVTEPGEPAFSRLHLWDGGVYDNLGLESLHNFEEGWREGVDFLIVSDGCDRLKPQRRRPWKAPMRMIRGIMMDQIRSLRCRAIRERLANHGDPGSLLQVGTTCETIFRDAGREDEIASLCPHCLDQRETDRAAEMGTVISRLSRQDFDRLFRHGFEVADCTLHANCPDEFRYLGYSDLDWG